MTSRQRSQLGVGSAGRRVLIVDDDDDSADLLSLLLEREGHETRIAHASAEAIPIALEFRPQLAFLDIGLPGMNGRELLAVLRSEPRLERCKFVAVTGFDKAVAGSRDFDAYLRKPLDIEAVLALVSEAAPGECVA